MSIGDPSIWAKWHVFINQRLKVWKDREFTMKGRTCYGAWQDLWLEYSMSNLPLFQIVDPYFVLISTLQGGQLYP